MHSPQIKVITKEHTFGTNWIVTVDVQMNWKYNKTKKRGNLQQEHAIKNTNEKIVVKRNIKDCVFTDLFGNKKYLYGRTRKAIEETIRICKERNVLKEYLESREGEVVTMMSTLFDYETIMKNHDATIRREERETAIASIVRVYKKMDGSMPDAIESVVSDYGYSEEDATAIVQKYWNETPVTINIPGPKED